MIILDFGSGNTCKNDLNYVKRMMDELKAVDTGKHEIVIKWQLFHEAGDNIPLDQSLFSSAYVYALEQGYKTTASIFDKYSLAFLMRHDIPFVKIANRPDLYWLAGEVPRKMPIIMSVSEIIDEYTPLLEGNYLLKKDAGYLQLLCCVSEYPATWQQYADRFTTNDYPGGSAEWLVHGISDHTTDFTLYHKYKPEIYECHYKLEDSTGLDSGDFARTPEQLAEIL